MKRPLKTPADQIAHVGRVLYGEHWRLALARGVQVDDDTIRRWMTGRTELRARHGVFDDALALMRRRQSEIATAADELEHWIQSNNAASSSPADASLDTSEKDKAHNDDLAVLQGEIEASLARKLIWNIVYALANERFRHHSPESIADESLSLLEHLLSKERHNPRGKI